MAPFRGRSPDCTAGPPDPATALKLTGCAEALICRAELVRQAREREYGMAEVNERLAAVEALRAMRLPVGPVEQMIAESVPDPQDLPD
jgi:hypothetical protein